MSGARRKRRDRDFIGPGLNHVFARRGETQLADVEGCCAEMRAFLRGGVAGRARLWRVLDRLWEHFAIPPPARRKLLARHGLRAYTDTLRGTLSFYVRERDD